MTIAIPIWQDRISPVLDSATRLLLVRRRRGVEVDRKELTLGVLTAEVLAQSIAQQRVDVLICGAVSEALLRMLISLGVRVESHVCGEVEPVLQAFYDGRLRCDEFRMPGCWGQHRPGELCRRRHPSEEGSLGYSRTKETP